MVTLTKKSVLSYECEIKRLNELVRVYRYDFLTNLKMRRDYFNDLKENNNKWLTIIDINDLHTLNRHPDGGYEAGDRLIIDTVNALKEISETANFNKDNIYRIGGDEFAIISDHKIEQYLTSIDRITFASEKIIHNTDYFNLIDMKIKTKKRLLYKNAEKRSN